MPTRFSIVLGITSVLLALAMYSQPVLGQTAATGQALAPGTSNRTLLRGKEPPVHYAL